MTQYFHFTLGPVQSFIAQARRTRDFWAGSFILSWLSAVAMKAVEAQSGCTIDFPKADENFLAWLEGDPQNGAKAPEQGGVPNRFKASVNDGFKPEAVVEAINTAWQTLAQAVYDGDLVGTGNVSQDIWHRQVDHFWEMNWIVASDDSVTLDTRKNWRSHFPPKEPGVKCMMMDGWQELSGAERPGDGNLKAFWQGIRDSGKTGIKTDLRPDEHLCAIAYIKRRFPRYFDKIDPSAPYRGWPVKPGRPSVAYMAAVHWLEHVFEAAKNSPEIKNQLWRFHDTAIELTDDQHNEWDNQIACIAELDAHQKWKALDGNVFFESAVANANIYEDQQQAPQVLAELKHLQKLVNAERKSRAAPGLPAPTPFYAVLMMDGDSLGEQMSNTDKQPIITQGLAEFTDRVPELVKQKNGFLIYAGGDDVLAVLPLEDALPCALKIREEYERIFAGLNQEKEPATQVKTSISAAVEFAHVKMPLTKVLKDAHSLLDDVAKDKHGRDSLAVRVWKPGGMILQWGMPWEIAVEDHNSGKRLFVERLAEDFADDDQDGRLGNTFLYKIRERFELLNSPPPDKKKKPNDAPKEKPFVLESEQAVDLMAAEYFSSGLCEKKYEPAQRMIHARAVVRPLLRQCRPVYRIADQADPKNWPKDDKVLADAAFLVRFLAQKGVNL